MEMSFVDQEDILVHLESLFKYVMKQMKGIEITDPFPRMTWQEAMDVYGSDKPDLRFGLPIVDLTGIAKTCSFSVFRSVADKGGVVRAAPSRSCPARPSATAPRAWPGSPSGRTEKSTPS